MTRNFEELAACEKHAINALVKALDGLDYAVEVASDVYGNDSEVFKRLCYASQRLEADIKDLRHRCLDAPSENAEQRSDDATEMSPAIFGSRRCQERRVVEIGEQPDAGRCTLQAGHNGAHVSHTGREWSSLW